MMFKFILLALLINAAQPQGTGGSLEDLIKEIFTSTQSPNPGPGPGPGPNPLPIPDIPVGNPCSEGECVPYYLCKDGQIITDGEGLLDIRFGEDEQKHPCREVLKTCCKVKSDTGPVIPPIPVPKVDGCGFRNPDGIGFRITGNTDFESQYGEFPWMVAILKEEHNNDQILNVYQCGGSLIHPSVVLTAAHCVQGKEPNTLKIRAGEWDTQTKDEIWPHQDRQVTRMVVHEEYYKGGLFNDIALLFLSEPVTIAENVNTVCLPPQGFNFDRSRCYATGWGKDQFGKQGKYSVILKRIDLPVMPRDQCQKNLRTTRLGQHFELHRSFLCAGGEPGKDTCKGDGGSPLVCPIPNTKNRYYQAGIVAWGIGCGETGIPGVYADVSLFRNWIDTHISSGRLDAQPYTA